MYRFHPDFHSSNSQIQREMMQYMKDWVSKLPIQHTAMQRLGKNAVRNHENIRLAGEGGPPAAQGTFAETEAHQFQSSLQGFASSHVPGFSQAQSLLGGAGQGRDVPGGPGYPGAGAQQYNQTRPGNANQSAPPPMSGASSFVLWGNSVLHPQTPLTVGLKAHHQARRTVCRAEARRRHWGSSRTVCPVEASRHSSPAMHPLTERPHSKVGRLRSRARAPGVRRVVRSANQHSQAQRQGTQASPSAGRRSLVWHLDSPGNKGGAPSFPGHDSGGYGYDNPPPWGMLMGTGTDTGTMDTDTAGPPAFPGSEGPPGFPGAGGPGGFGGPPGPPGPGGGTIWIPAGPVRRAPISWCAWRE